MTSVALGTGTRAAAAKVIAALRCPICLDSVSAQPATLSSCGHLFCKPCIKAALHVKKECPVCRSAATHRMVREALLSDSVRGEPKTLGRSCMDADGADAPIPEGAGSWTCRACTMSNTEADSRCNVCGYRRPSEYIGRPPERPQRYQIVPARPTGKRVRASERAKRDVQGDKEPVQDSSSEEDDDEDGDEGDQLVPANTIPQRIWAPALLYNGGRRQRAEWANGSRKPHEKVQARAITSPRLQRLRAPSKSGDCATSPASTEAPSDGSWPLISSIWNCASGYKNVHINRSQKAAKKPWQAKDDYGKSLGMYATPKEAALAYSKSLGYEVAKQLAETVQKERKPMTKEEAEQTAADEGLTLKLREGQGSKSFANVFELGRKGPRRFIARLHHAGQRRMLGCFKTGEEAALEVARFYRAAHGAAPLKGRRGTKWKSKE